jgi:hypothetical protein
MEIIVSLAYYFKQIISANLDLFYFIALYIILIDLIKYKGVIFVKTFYIMWLVVIYAAFQNVFIRDIDSIKLIVNVMKIWIGFYLFFYIKDNIDKIPLRKIVDYITYLYIISIPVSFIFQNTILWRHNDSGNIYSKTRLQLFYYEPSVLAYQLTIIIILLVHYLFKSRNNKEKRKYVVFIIAMCVLVYLSKSLIGVASIIMSCTFMYIIYVHRNNSHRIWAINVIVILFFMAFLFFFFNSNNQISLRILDVINGNDGSFSYRMFNGLNVMINALDNTNFFGLGFGSVNTQRIAIQYSNYGLIGVIANSFMYFITEGGICAIVYLAFLIGYLTKNVYKNKSILKIGLFIFIISSQIPGGYFTDPMNWIVYGIICSKEDI